MGTGHLNPRGVQNMAVFAYDCKTTTKNIVQKLSTEFEIFLKQFHMKTEGGHPALLSIMQLCLGAALLKLTKDQ